MAIAYHVHSFVIPTATDEEAAAGLIDTKAISPVNLPPILATKQNVSTALTSISGLTTSANQTIYTTAENAYATTALTSIGRSLIGSANAAAIRELIDAQQQFDSLDALGALSPLADRLPYFTDTNAAALTTFTSFARTLLDDGDAATARATLGATGYAEVVYRIELFADADTATIPSAVNRLFIEDRGAHWKRVDAEPAHALKFLNGAQWWEIDEAIVRPEMAGAIGDGVANDAQALSDVFSSGFPVAAGAKTYLIDAATVEVLHPSSFQGGVGPGKTRFVFTNMGGFSGLDGFNVTIPSDAEYGSATKWTGYSVHISGAHGRSMFKTPREIDPGELGLFRTVRPSFTFEHIQVSGLERVSVGSDLLSLWGWQTTWDIGECQMPTWRDVIVGGCFNIRQNVASWASKDTTVHWKVGGGANTADGGFVVYMPQWDHCQSQGHGRAIEFLYGVNLPRVSDCEFTLGGGAVYCGIDDVIGPSGVGLSEVTIAQCNFNGIFPQIHFTRVDYIDITAVRTTYSSSATTDYVADWYGLWIEDEVRQADIRGFRAYAARSNATNQHTGIRMTGQISGGSGVAAVANITDFFWLNNTANENTFETGIRLTDFSRSTVTNAWGTGNIKDVVLLDGAVITSPRHDFKAQRVGAVINNTVRVGSGVSDINVRYPLEGRYKNVDPSAVAITTTGSEDIIVNQSNQVLRRSMNANVVHTMNFLATNAVEGDSFHVHITMLSSAPGTAGFVLRDNAGVTQITINGTSATARYFVEMVYTGAVWRVIKASTSLA